MIGSARSLRASRAVLLAATVVFLALSFDRLSSYPPIGDDEPWIAAAPFKLATEGVYGSDLFAGYYGAERHNYQHPPLYPLLQALVFRAFGMGAFQMRLVAVLFGLALLLVVFRIAADLVDRRVAIVSVLLMLVLAVAAEGGATGVLLLDRARVNRYDVAVPVFGLLALWTCGRAQAGRTRAPHTVAGLLAGLASLAHFFGAFWLPILIALSLRVTPSPVPRRDRAALVVAGFALPWLPWLAFIASGWDDFAGQMRFVAARLDLLDPSFYIGNALYGSGPISLDWIARSVRDLRWQRPGACITVVGLPLAAGMLLWSARRPDARQQGVALVALATLAQAGMFLALLKVKTINYTIGIWPLAVILLAWLAVRLWDTRALAIRVLVTAIAAAAAAEGVGGIARAVAAARDVDSYDRYTGEIVGCLPAGARVIGLPRYWLGLRHYDYRTWLVPAILANPAYHDPRVPFDVTLTGIDPDILLIDDGMATFFANVSRADHPLHRVHLEYQRFRTARGVEPVCAVESPTYGTLRVYRAPRPPR